jgi:RNA polymerase sigma-70 factor (ECF subfamily)
MISLLSEKTLLTPEKQQQLFLAGLYTKYAPKLLNYLTQLVQERTLAEDLLQESFIKIWKGLPDYELKDRKLVNWLFCIAHNTARDYLRTYRPEWYSLDTCAPELLPVCTPNYTGIGLMGMTATLLEAKYQQVIEMIYEQNYTMQEVADELNLPLGTIKTRTRYALHYLREFFEKKKECADLFMNEFVDFQP